MRRAPDSGTCWSFPASSSKPSADFRAHIGVALNVTPDHLDRHHTFENYAAAKGRLFEKQRPDDFAVLNADDPVCVRYAALTQAGRSGSAARAPSGPASGCENGEDLVRRRAADAGRRDSAARAAQRRKHHGGGRGGQLAGASLPQIAAAVRTFRAVEHRLEFVRNVGGVDWYNDSKATNVDATLKALDAFAGGLWVILGGKDKDSDYTVLRAAAAAKARAALLIGAAAAKDRASRSRAPCR